MIDFQEQAAKSQQSVIEGIQAIFPYDGRTQRLEADRIWIEQKPGAEGDYGAQKEIKAKGGTLALPVYGNFKLIDIESGKVIDRQKKVKIASLPLPTLRNSYIVKGSEYQIANQMRLLPGVYTRVRDDGDLESQVNLARGLNFRIWLNPKTYVFYMVFGTSSRVMLYHVLTALGVGRAQMEQQWGKEITEANAKKSSESSEIRKLYKILFRNEAPSDLAPAIAEIADYLGRTEIDKGTTKTTLGKSYSKVDTSLLLSTTQKILRVLRKQDNADDRDSLEFKRTLSVDDFLKERLTQPDNVRKIRNKLRNNIDRQQEIRRILVTGLFNQPIESFFTKGDTGLSSTPEQTNPLHMISESDKVVLTGTGGITNPHAITTEARAVHPSSLGFVDPVATPESSRIGTTLHLPLGAKKKGQSLTTSMYDVKSGKLVDLPASEAHRAVVSFRDQYKEQGGKLVPRSRTVKASANGTIKMVPASRVQYVLPTAQAAFSLATNMLPFLPSNQGNRAMMASKQLAQALPLINREAPLVQVVSEKGRTYESVVGQNFSHKSPVDGTVTRLDTDYIYIKATDGKSHKVPIYRNFPLNGKTGIIDSDVRVKAGDKVRKGQLLADSNYTKNGQLALGVNARVAYVPHKGLNFEDGVSVSESFAKKATSDHMYKLHADVDANTVLNLKKFRAYYPNNIDLAKASKLDDNGVIKRGQKVRMGDVLIAVLRKEESSPEDRVLSKIHRSFVRPYKNRSIVWEEEDEGEVVTVIRTAKRVEVHVRTKEVIKIGDKLSSRSANKGTVTTIIADNDMPHTRDGKPIDVMMNPMGIPSRINPSQILETVAGKVAEKTGRPFTVRNFSGEDYRDSVEAAAKSAGVQDKEDLIDPNSGKTIPAVTVGNQYILKLDHPTRKKFSARAQGPGYTAELQPTRGKHEGGQALDALTLYSMLSHGSLVNLREMGTIKAEKNDEVWRALQMGQALPAPQTTFAFQKFTDMLRGAGVNVQKDGNQLSLSPLTDKHTLAQSEGEIQNSQVVRGKDLRPEKGGLFDPEITGGIQGCFHPSVKIWTEEGMLPIGDIVKSKRKIKVWSYNFEKESFELQPITNWFRNYSEEGIGRSSFFSAGRLASRFTRFRITTLWGTRGHQVYDISGNKHDLSSVTSLVSATERLSYSQQQVLYGSLLGDAGIAHAHFYEMHAVSQREYLKFKRDIMGSLVSKWTPYFPREGRQAGCRLRTKAHTSFRNAQEDIYINGRKTVSIDWLDKIDALGLMFWFMDDGSVHRCRDKNSIRIIMSTHCFSHKEVGIIREWLCAKWGIESREGRDHKKYGDRDCGWCIDLSSNNAWKLLEIIAPYMEREWAKLPSPPRMSQCECGKRIEPSRKYCDACILDQARSCGTSKISKTVRHRIGLSSEVREIISGKSEWASTDDDWLSREKSILGALGSHCDAARCDTKIKVSLEEIPCEYKWKTGARWECTQTVYDIEVSGNHNYVANGILVSNSRWNHIKLNEPMPNPVFENAIKAILDMKQQAYDDIISGKRFVDKKGRVFLEPGKDRVTAGKAFQILLKKIKPDEMIARLIEQSKTKKGPELDKINKKIRYLKALQENKIKPQDYVVQNVPVIPARLRPVYALADGSLDVTEVNHLYRDLIEVNNHSKEYEKLGMPEAEKSKLRDSAYQAMKAVAGLAPSIDGRNRKGLIDQIRGNTNKEGFFQNRIMRRRQEMTGRSTIVPDPELGLDQVSLPEEMAWKIYQPHVVRNLHQQGYRPLDAREQMEKRTPLAKKALEVAMRDRPVMLNRAPSLHKFSVMAFKPQITTGKAIKINPLIVKGYNADFDGDTMSVHVPVSEDARQEAHKMLPSRNLWNPRNGELMNHPSLEAVAGLYMHTHTKKGRDEVNKLLPKGWKVTGPMTEKSMMAMLSDIAKRKPGSFTRVVNSLKDIGNRESFHRGLTIGMEDLRFDPRVKKRIFAEADKKARKKGNTDDAIVEAYTEASKKLDKAIMSDKKMAANGFRIMADSGAKGNRSQIRQILAAPVLVQDISGKTVPVPIKRSYAEGLDMGDYWASMSGARKGMIDRALQTSEPGALSKELLNSTVSEVIAKSDCGTIHGTEVLITDRDITDRYLAKTVRGVGRRNDLVTHHTLSKAKRKKIKALLVRSPLTCAVPQGICQKCYGLDEYGKPPAIGKNVGVAAGQAIGERATQLTMRTFHTGAAAGGGSLTAGFQRVKEILEMPKKLRNQAALAKKSGKISSVKTSPIGGWDVMIGDEKHHVPASRRLLVKKGQSVKAGDRLSDGAISPQELLELKGMRETQDYLVNQVVGEYANQGVRINRKIAETAIRPLTTMATVMHHGGHETLVPGDHAPMSEIESFNRRQTDPSMRIQAQPLLRGINTRPLVSEDWLSRLNFQRLHQTIQEGAAQSWKTDIASPFAPLAAYAYGPHIGKKKPT